MMNVFPIPGKILANNTSKTSLFLRTGGAGKFLNTKTPVSLTDGSFINISITSNKASTAAGRLEVVFRQIISLFKTVFSQISIFFSFNRFFTTRGKNLNKLLLLFFSALFLCLSAHADYTVADGANIAASSLVGQSGVLTINGTITVSTNVALSGFTSVIINAPNGKIYWSNNSDLTFSSGTTIDINTGAPGLQSNDNNGSQRLLIGGIIIAVSSTHSNNSPFDFTQFNQLGGLPDYNSNSNSNVCSGSAIISSVTPAKTVSGVSYTYLWSISPSSGSFTYNGDHSIATIYPAVGNYTITCVASANSYQTTFDFNVTIPATPVQPMLGAATQPTCATATGTFTISNYNALYTYAASPSTGVTISGSTVTAPAVSYTITATSGCTSVASASTTVNAQPATPVQPTLGAVTQPTFATSTGTFTISNYSASYTYAATPSTGVTISGSTVTAPAGSYTIRATSGSCTSVTSTSVTVNAQPATPVQPTLGAVTQPTCATVTGTFTISNYSASYTYAATPSTGVTISGSTVTAPAGSYRITATLGSCTSVTSASVTVNPQPATPSAPTISAGGTTTFCAGGSVTLTSSAGSTYLWSTGATTASITVNTSGSYSVKVTNASACQSVSSANTTVTVNALPATPTATVTSQPTCTVSTGTITITAPTGMNYSIDGVSYTNTTGSFTGVNPGTYNITAKNSNGCMSTSASVTVNVQPATPSAPTISAGGPTTFCTGGSVTLTSSAGSTYLWSNGATTASVTVSASGNYSVQVTNASGCQSASSTVTTVTVNALPVTPTAIVTSQPTCTVSTGTITITAPTGMNYSIDGATYTNTTGSFTGVNPGTYNVTAKNTNGCISSSTSVTVNVQPATPSAPTISAGGPTTFCAGGSVTLTSSAGSTYLWSTGATTASITVNASGSYSVKVTNMSACQSASSANTTVTVNALPATPTATVTSQPTCTVSTGTITITAPTGMNYSIDGVSYTNTTGSFTGVNPGTYNITAKNSNGCISSPKSVTVNALIQPSATISYSGSPFCASAGNILPVISGTSGGVFTSTTGLSINGASGAISVASSTPGNYTITYTIAAAGDCTVFTTTTSLTILAPGSWSGGISTDWNDPSNWVCGPIPTSAIDVTIPAGSTFYPIITSGTGYAKNITVQSGASLIISGGALQISGAIANAGDFDASKGTLEMKGAGAQTIAGSMFTNKTIKNLIVSNTSSGLSISSAANDTLKITGTLSFGNSTSTLNTGGNLTLVSDSLGTASVGKVAAGNSINGQAIVERYINIGTIGGRHGKSWQFLSAPVNGQSVKQSWMENEVKTTNYGTMVSSPAGTAAGFDTVSVSPSLKYYIDSTNSWKGIPNTDTLVNNPLGYFVFVRGDRTITKVNQVATATTLRAKGTLSVGTLAAINIKPDLFQSIGNPYASPVDFTLLTKSPTVDTLFYAWDPYLYGAYGFGGYQVLSGVNGWKPVPGGTLAYPSGVGDSIIQSGQAIFVHATSSGHAMRTYGAVPSATIAFTEDAKVSGGGTVNFARKAEKVSSTQLQALSVSLFTGPNQNDLMADGNTVVFGQNYSDKVDGKDALKIANSGENFGLQTEGKSLSIDARAPLTVADTLNYNMSNLARRTYQLRFAPVNLQSAGLHAFLIDGFLKTETPVSLSDSSFVDVTITSNSASSAANRFMVVFRQLGVLPVTITSVSASHKNQDNVIQWNVQNEKGIQQYSVEKSTDGNHFNQLAIVNPLNNGVGNYNSIDENVTAGTNFYRVKIISVDGKANYSPIVKVINGKIPGSISVYPNPIKDGVIHLQLNNQPSGIYKIKLYNSVGQVLISKNITHEEGSSNEIIGCGNLPKEIYQLEVIKPNGNDEVIKIIK